ncbi:MAG: cytochrome c biogenesis protein ResB [Myxococcales bacterium]|nr:cytochrome c biogenesis protein ResB [Myxococcales bacterium]
MRASNSAAWLQRPLAWLASGRLTVWLLAILVLLLAAHLFVPQQGEVSARVVERWIEHKGIAGRLARALGLTDVLHAPLFAGTCALLFLNLVCCMIRRLRATLGLFRFPQQAPQPAASWLRCELPATDLDEARIAALLHGAGYRALVASGSVYGLRGRFSIAGHWLFHLGLLALLVVGSWLALTPAPFRGTVGVGEGEAFDLHTARFLSSRGPVGPELPGLRFQIEQLEIQTEGTQVRRFDGRILTPEGDVVHFGVNRPFRRAPYQVLVHGFGRMAGWVIANERGRMIGGAWVKLVPFPLERSEDFSLGAEDSSVHVRLYPDYEREAGEDRSRSHALRNPRFAARVVWRGETVHDGLLAPEQRVTLQPGLAFFFLPEIRAYGLLEVIQERGQRSVFACLAVMILGLLVRYGRLRKEILVQRVGESLRVFGHGETFESLFEEEFGRLGSALARAGARPADRGGAA